MSEQPFYFGLCDTDAPVGSTFFTGEGFDALIDALRNITALEAEQTPEGFIPSGNIALYWSRSARIIGVVGEASA